MAVMIVPKPCCNSIRSCSVEAVYVLDINTENIIYKVKAERCYKLGFRPTAQIKYDPQHHLIYYLYVSNRGNPHIKFYHIPSTISELQARELVLRAHGLIH